MNPDLQAVRDDALRRIAVDERSGRLFDGRRLHGWHRDVPSEAECARLLDADPGPTVEAVSRTRWEDAGADNYDPDDELTHPGGSRWERNVLGEAYRHG